MDYYIYITTNKINGKKYIGQHKGKPEDGYLGSGTNIIKAINKYGKENFSKKILCFCETREEADAKEKYYIEYYNAVDDNNFYNLSEGGTGGDGWRACRRWMEEHPEKAQKIYQESYNRLLQWKENNPELYKEKVIGTLVKSSKQYWDSHPKEKQERKERLQEGRKKFWEENPEWHQEQVDKWRQAGSIKNSKPVKCITTGEIFPSQCEASRYYNIPQPNISKCLRGERKSAGKHPITGEKMSWKFVDKLD